MHQTCKVVGHGPGRLLNGTIHDIVGVFVSAEQDLPTLSCSRFPARKALVILLLRPVEHTDAGLRQGAASRQNFWATSRQLHWLKVQGGRQLHQAHR